MTNQCDLCSDCQSCLLEDRACNECKLVNCPIHLATQLPFNQTRDDSMNDILKQDDNLISLGGLNTQDLLKLIIFDDSIEQTSHYQH